MSIRSSLIIGVVATTAALGVGSPAFAQAWSNGWGTGNSQPGYSTRMAGCMRGMRHGSCRLSHLAVGSTHSLAIIVGSPDSRAFGIHIAVQINPAPTARGTIGHNQMLKSDQL